MPQRPGHPCREPHCGKIAPAGQGRCAEHQALYYQRREALRGDRHERGYDSRWDVIRIRILDRDGHRCHYCGAPATSVDHVIAKARGGSDDDTNLVAACLSCNARKRDR